MSYLSKTVITNVEASYIETYFRQKGVVRTDEEKGQELEYWGTKVLEDKKIDITDFENFLFEELFWGKRKTIRIYKLNKVNKVKYPKDWLEPLESKYGVTSLNFNNILGLFPNRDEKRKIVAVHSEENDKGELINIQILFALYIQVNGDGGYVDSGTYIPVEIDFKRKIMSIKAWNRQQISHEEDKLESQMEHIKRLIHLQFKVNTSAYGSDHKKVLFNMSQRLINEAYSKVPTFNQVGDLSTIVGEFVQSILGNLALSTVYQDESGRNKIPEGVMEFDSEIVNIIESLVISDYFFERDFEEIWKIGLEAVVAKVKFNDKERVLTSLSGENNNIPIFCTKTFMTLKKRMEESKRIETLWITMDRKKGNLNLKYDATNPEYLEVLIRYGIRFNEADMNSTLEIYEKYESIPIEAVTGENKVAVS